MINDAIAMPRVFFQMIYKNRYVTYALNVRGYMTVALMQPITATIM
jgi:hypothetical protein